MTGVRNGVAKQLTDEEPWAIFTHCYDHALNHAVGDIVKKCKLMRSCLDAVFWNHNVKSRSLRNEMQYFKSSNMTVQLIHQAFVFSAILGGQSVQHHYRVCSTIMKFSFVFWRNPRIHKLTVKWRPELLVLRPKCSLSTSFLVFP